MISASSGYSPASVKVQREYENMLKKLGPEFSILREIPLEEIRSVSGILISEGIGRLREGKVTRIPGFDGEYGIIRLFTPQEADRLSGQLSLFDGQNGLPEAKPSGHSDCLQNSREPVAPSSLPGTSQAASAGLQNPENSKGVHSFQKDAANENQRLAIESIGRVTLVTAGPGTGKTHTLISHLLYLLTSFCFMMQTQSHPCNHHESPLVKGCIEIDTRSYSLNHSQPDYWWFIAN